MYKFNKKGYKTAKILIEALKIDPNVLNLKQTILRKKEFNTITGKIVFNKYGDIQTKQTVTQIHDKKFIEVTFE